MKKYPKTIGEIYAVTPHDEILDKLRLLIRNTIPQAAESVRRGGITYRLNEKDFLRIHNYKNHVDLGFVNGTSLSSLLLRRRGKRTSWRHIELKTPADVSNSEIERLLKRSEEFFLL
jgi:hypothetical protein